MSAVGSPPPPDLMRTYMLRSSTPASNEKVLLYLEGMQKAPPDEDGGSSVRSSKHTRSQLSRGPASNADEDARSDIQEMNQSEVARTIPIHTTGIQEEIPDHEPGPNDPPGPKFESYGSSFGNFGPLRDSLPPINNWNGQAWTSPSKAAGVPLPETVVSPGTIFANPFQEFGMAPLEGTSVPLPASVASGPSRKTAQMSQKAPSVAVGNELLSPKSAARPMSPPRTANGNGQSHERSFSPRSGISQQPSRVTQKTSKSAYPPLPESTMEEPMFSRAASPPARSHNKTPSIAPSESASQAPRMRAQKSVSQKEPSQKPSRSIKGASDVNGSYPEPAKSTASRAAPSQRDALLSRSQALSPRSQASRALSQRTNDELFKAASAVSASRSHRHHDPEITPTPSRPASPLQDLNAEEQRLVNEFLTRPVGTRTSYAQSTMAASTLEPEIQHSHFHDGELCQLLHALDTPMADPVKKAIRKAVRARVKKLGMKYDNESIRQYRKSYHDHSPAIHLTGEMAAGLHQLATMDEPPEWAKNLLENVAHLTAKVDRVDTKVDKVVELRSSRGAGSFVNDSRSFPNGQHDGHYAQSESRTGYVPSPMTQSANLQPRTENDDDMYTEAAHDHGPGEEEEYYEEEDGHVTNQDEETRGGIPSEYTEREHSPGNQFLQEELYKLRVKPHTGSQSAATHKTWEVARDDGGEFFDEGDTQAAVTESGLPEIPDAHTGNYAPTERSLPPIPREGEELIPQPAWPAADFSADARGPMPWQRIHQRLLSWAIVWPMSELENALNSTTRGHQVDEIALSIWSTQSYKRYVRSRMTESPPERVDRLFVPPNMAEAISTAVYHGRHGDACGMLRDLWAPFGLEGIPRLLVVLAKHRNLENHWVVHRFSLPDGSLTTYDTYPEKSLPDGRPLGWWFAIRIAWPDAIYPSPDRLMQKMVRLHRPMQLAIDNSVAAAGIWRNILMASRAERSLDLERLRDLINQEVKNLRQRKMLGKLSIGSPRPNWEDMH
ncbi:hypothetical protein BC835DRAFT_1414795 [Cytidiella melzeri]|nr:hypothetical protein BC835DRAFT_1414795 [Cytidiella melzeri]